ncbi:helix-turn-helix domain-containing protein, partial [Streptomyces sp. NPDC005877]|uniref:helix-turn-helix domain-containing protein n=1 Tax=Streptomyces sp. NPDC005877 TaxID=3155346 RepID=UPI0033CBE8C1
MSTEAMDWALELAPPMPAQLVATLSGLARHADKKGRGAYPSVARLAAYTCKAERSVQRDLKQLRDLGLIRLGDQSKAAHLPEGKRPEVYDLALERVVPGGRAGSDEVTRASRVTLTSSRRRGGQKTSSDGTWGDVHVTGDVDVTGDADDTPDVGVTPRPPHRSANGKRGSSEGAGTSTNWWASMSSCGTARSSSISGSSSPAGNRASSSTMRV